MKYNIFQKKITQTGAELELLEKNQKMIARVADGKYVSKEVRKTRWEWRSGSFNQYFDDVLIVASKGLPENIMPGMNADMSIEIMKKQAAVLLPMAAITNGHILLKKDKGSKKLPVVVGVTDSEYVEILSPALNVNDEILLPKESQK